MSDQNVNANTTNSQHQYDGGQIESRLIPWWSYVLAIGFFGLTPYLFLAVLRPLEQHPKPLVWTIVWGVITGLFIAFYMLMIGYVMRDARRRGMNPVVWLLIMVSLFMTGVGFIIYFLLRQPIVMRCPHCSGAIQSGNNFCPRCQFQLNPTCGHCQRAVHLGDAYCAHCGSAVNDNKQVLAVR